MTIPPQLRSWQIEPTVFFIVSYYPTNSLSQEPSYVDPFMDSYPRAVARAKQLIVQANNVGVCTIQPVTCTVVYPFTSLATD